MDAPPSILVMDLDDPRDGRSIVLGVPLVRLGLTRELGKRPYLLGRRGGLRLRSARRPRKDQREGEKPGTHRPSTGVRILL